jgi:hypothetical protein
MLEKDDGKITDDVYSIVDETCRVNKTKCI